MSEFILVDHPSIYPQACVVCQSAKGPLVDTVREGKLAGPANPDRIYLCHLCVKYSAATLGLVKGERMEQLLKAGELLDEAGKGLVARDTQIAAQLQELAARSRKIEALEELLQQGRDAERQRRHQLETISETSKQLLAGANGG